MWFPNRSDTNRPVQAQKKARSLKFRLYVEEELYYPSSENKGADQLCGYCEADLRLCFRLCRLLVFPRGGSYCDIRKLSEFLSTFNINWAVDSQKMAKAMKFVFCKKRAGDYLYCRNKSSDQLQSYCSSDLCH